MKKLLLVSMVLLLTLAAYGGRASGSTAEERGISLGIIVDTSPCSQKTWNVFQAAILEMTYQLRRGDKITVYTAHPGKPRLRIVRVISSEGKHHTSDVIRETTSFSRELLSGANLSRAVERVFEDFHRETNEYQHCLVVLSKGKVSSKQVAQIKKLVVNFENNDWPVRFICERTHASRSLLVAANNQQLDLRMHDKPELTEWINAARELNDNKISLANDTNSDVDKKDAIGKKKVVKPVPDSNDHKPTDADGKPIKVEVINFPGLQIGKPKVSDPNDGLVKKVDVDKETVIEPDGEKDLPGLDEEVDLPKDPKANKWWLCAVALLLTVTIAGLWYFSKKNLPTDSLDEQLGNQLDGHENLQQRLIWLAGEQRQDLGDIATLGEVVIGRAIGSSIYIDDENVEERHVRIFKSGKRVKVQNLAASAISVDGKQLNRRQKTDLLLPADIELAGGAVVSLTAEDVNSNSIESEGEDHDDKQRI